MDVLAIGVNYWVEQMVANATELINDRREKLLDEELEKFIDGILSRKGQNNQNTWM